MSDRFEICELTGDRILPHGERGMGRTPTSFYILDRLYLYNVVATFENGPRQHAGQVQLRRAAERECARLNAW